MTDMKESQIGASDGGFPERASVVKGEYSATAALEAQATVLQRSKAEGVAAAWRDLERRAGKDFSAAMAPFGGFCIANNIAPLDVSSESAARFSVHWLDTHDRKSGTQSVRRIFDFWNANANRLGVCVVDPPLPRADRDSYRADLADASSAMRSQIEDLRSGWMTQPRRGRVLDAESADRRLYTLMLYAGAACEALRRAWSSIDHRQLAQCPWVSHASGGPLDRRPAARHAFEHGIRRNLPLQPGRSPHR